MSRTVLVVGTSKGSLGDHIAETLRALVVYDRPEEHQWSVVPAGIDEESAYLDVANNTYGELCSFLSDLKPDHIVCTAGINQPEEHYPTYHSWYQKHFQVNCIGPMRLLEAWLAVLDGSQQTEMPRHYVAISSNSAHIARSQSAAYCASKAGLSMALRCKARDMAGIPVVVHGYEPGLLQDTPMTHDVAKRLPGKALTRIPGQPRGLPTANLARQIARNVVFGGVELNGCMLRVDGGDQ